MPPASAPVQQCQVGAEDARFGGGQSEIALAQTFGPRSPHSITTIYDFKTNLLDGTPQNVGAYCGKVLC